MENYSTPCKLRIPKDLHHKTPGFLVNFSNGSVNRKFSRKLQYKCLLPVDVKDKRILVANSDRLMYQSDFVTRACDQDQSKLRYYIGVRNKTSGKMKVYDALSFHLKPILKADPEPSSSTSGERSHRDKMADLTANFGSKEMKRSMNARLKYSTDAKPLEHTLEDMSLNGSFQGADHSISLPSSSNIEYIPPQNIDAKSVDEVYRITDIIPFEDDHLLTQLADKLLEDLPHSLPQWTSDSTYCEYVLNHLNTSLDEVKVKYLVYYNFLVEFSLLLASDMRKRDPAPGIPEPIKSNLLQFYTISNEIESGKIVRHFSQVMKDKLLAYMLVLALFIDDFSVNLAEVQSGTKFGMQKLVAIAQALGCYVTRRKIENSAIQFAELKLPLFVKPKYYKKK